MTQASAEHEHFTTTTADLPACGPTEVVKLDDGDTYELRIGPVANRIGQHTVRMVAYNGSIPGPTLRVPQGAEISVRVRNDGDHEATVHWHGLRLQNEFDGVPEDTQAPIPVGGEFTYKLRFPDDGVYWYHPHVREDYGIEMGLYGNILVEPREATRLQPVNREAIVTLDDILIEGGKIAPFRVDGPTHTAMGRFGNVMLTGGTPNFTLNALAGEVVRFYLTNTANTRIFSLAIPRTRMKLVGGDSGCYERQEWVERVLLSPSERAIVDVLFDQPGVFRIEHRTPDGPRELGRVFVASEPSAESFGREFETLLQNEDLARERAGMAETLDRAPDKTLVFASVMPMMHEAMEGDGSMDHEHGHHMHGSGDGLEWEDLMAEMNAETDDSNMFWKIIDADTGLENRDIDWSFRVGERVKLRIVNTMESDHPMHHPFHMHGAGRFLVIARDGTPEPNLVWTDTVLVRAGETVDLLLDLTSPGLWMAHCHIAEHNQDGMMFNFRVAGD